MVLLCRSVQSRGGIIMSSLSRDGIIMSVCLGVVLLCPFGQFDGIIMSVRFRSKGWYYYVRSVQFV